MTSTELIGIQRLIAQGRGAIIDGPGGDRVAFRPVVTEGKASWSVEYDGRERQADTLITEFVRSPRAGTKGLVDGLQVTSVRYFNGRPALMGEILILAPDVYSFVPASEASEAPAELLPELQAVAVGAEGLSTAVATYLPMASDELRGPLEALQRAIAEALTAIRGEASDLRRRTRQGLQDRAQVGEQLDSQPDHGAEGPGGFPRGHGLHKHREGG